MTGRPPFVSDDGMALVHDHIAKQPAPPHEINPQLPQMLSQVILKLLSKDAAQRYQSSVGLVHDLRFCLQAHQRGEHELDFTPGEQDLSARFRFHSGSMAAKRCWNSCTVCMMVAVMDKARWY